MSITVWTLAFLLGAMQGPDVVPVDCACSYDLDQSGFVDLGDFAVMQNEWDVDWWGKVELGL